MEKDKKKFKISSAFFKRIVIRKNKLYIEFDYNGEYKSALVERIKDELNIELKTTDVGVSLINGVKRFYIINEKVNKILLEEYRKILDFNNQYVYNKKNIFFKFKLMLLKALGLFCAGIFSFIMFMRFTDYIRHSVSSKPFLLFVNLIFSGAVFLFSLVFMNYVGASILSLALLIIINIAFIKKLTNVEIYEWLSDKSSLALFEIFLLLISIYLSFGFMIISNVEDSFGIAILVIVYIIMLCCYGIVVYKSIYGTILTNKND